MFVNSFVENFVVRIVAPEMVKEFFRGKVREFFRGKIRGTNRGTKKGGRILSWISS